jgi:RNA polymerase sigma factor (sigma-70 family)
MEAAVMIRFEKTYREKRKTLLKYIRSRISSLEEAEDILQEVFYQAVRNQNTLEPINNIMSWLYRTAKNKVIDWYRKKKRGTVSIHKPINNDITLEDLISDSGIDVEKDFIRSLVFEAIYKSINQQPEKQRDVLVKREFRNMSYKEIAEETGISINTLLAQKRYANKFLTKRLLTVKKILEEY